MNIKKDVVNMSNRVYTFEEVEKMNKIIFSTTGEIHGRSSDPYKWVSRLTAAERAHVLAGGTVLIRDHAARHHTQSGWKRVVYRHGRYMHREATAAQIQTINLEG